MTTEVRVNGEDRRLPEGSTVASLLETMGLDASRVAVEIDGDICPRSSFSERRISGGEKIEVVSFVGGG